MSYRDDLNRAIRGQAPYLGNPESETLDSIKHARERLKFDDLTISWGLPALDKKIGAPRPGQLCIVGARSGNGKTTFLLNMMIRLHDGMIRSGSDYSYRTCYLGTEMEPPELMLLWSSIYLGYDPDLVLSNRWHLLPDTARSNIEKHLEILEMETDRTWLPRCLQPTIEDVLDNVDAAIRFGANVVIFDHLHRLQPRSKQTEREALQEATVALKTAATEHGILVIAASQLKREDHGVFDRYRPPHLGSFMGSSAIEGNADIALGLYRPLKSMNTKQERAIRNGDLSLEQFIRPNVMAAKCVKHRYRGSITDTVVLLTAKDGRVHDYIDEWEDINKEDQHGNVVREPRAMQHLQGARQLPETGEGESGRGSDPVDDSVSTLPLDL